MKGFRKTISMNKGLRVDSAQPFNSAYLNKAMGIKTGPQGLELLPTITDPLQSTPTINHPTPQLIGLQQKNLLIDATTIYTVNSDWSITSAATILSGAQAHIADFGPYVMFTNGVQVYHCDVTTGAWSVATGTDIPKMSTLCRLKGRIFGGGILDDWNSCDERYACWSAPGYNKFTPTMKNTSGFRDMEIGTIRACLPLADKSVVYYGDQGVAMLIPTTSGVGYQKLSNVQICGREGVSGGVIHLFCDKSGKLWMVQSDSSITEVATLSLDLSNIVVSHDDVNKDFYISNGSACYVLNQRGLTQSNKFFTSIATINGTPQGIFASGSEDYIEIYLDDFNFGLATMSSLEFLELGISTDGTVYIGESFKYGNQTAQTFAYQLAGDLFSYLGVTANLHRPKIKITNATEFKLDFITMGIKLSDNRVQNQLQTISEGSWNVS